MQHKSAYQVSASQVSMVANDDGSKSGVFCVVKEFFVHLKLKLKVKINAHGVKKVGLNQNDGSDHFLSAKRLHTRPTFGSIDRFLLLKPFHPSHGQTRSTQVVYLPRYIF